MTHTGLYNIGVTSVVFFSLDRPMTKNLTQNTKCQLNFLFSYHFKEKRQPFSMKRTFVVIKTQMQFYQLHERLQVSSFKKANWPIIYSDQFSSKILICITGGPPLVRSPLVQIPLVQLYYFHFRLKAV